MSSNSPGKPESVMDIVNITIVVATYNRGPMLRKALKSLVQQETDGKFFYDILVVDDGSTDQTAEVVQDMSHIASGVPVTYIYQENAGQSSGRNVGIERARGSWLAFFDDDQWAEPGWLAELYHTAEELKADCVGGAVCLDLPESPLQKPGGQTRGMLGEKIPGQRLKADEVKDLIGTGNVLIHRSVFNQVGAFDTIFRGYDTNFFWRIEKGGFLLGYAPQAVIHHVIPESRLQPSYLRRLCFVRGVATARIHWQYQGTRRLVLSNLWRLGVALGRDLPLITIAAFSRHHQLVLDSLCSLWYTFSFIRGSLFFLAPRWFPQKNFMAFFTGVRGGAK